jgi:hypothetical protein
MIFGFFRTDLPLKRIWTNENTGGTEQLIKAIEKAKLSLTMVTVVVTRFFVSSFNLNQELREVFYVLVPMNCWLLQLFDSRYFVS